MDDPLEIRPIERPIYATVRPPGSKSITNRALVCAALADGESQLTGALDSEDTRMMIEGLRCLGIGIEAADAGETLIVAGAGGDVPALEADLFCANSGTTIRFLTALATLGHGAFRLDGVERMRERPIGDLIEALKQLGADVRSENGNGCPPVIVHSNGLPGGTATVRGDVSSQFLSALLMAAAVANSPVELVIGGQLVSQPYVKLTASVMRAFGVDVKVARDLSRFEIRAPQMYAACRYAVEPDASAASYFWAAGAITGGQVTVKGLSPASLQGDVAFVDCLEMMGCQVWRKQKSLTVAPSGVLHGIDVDMNAISDTAQTLAVVALFATGPTRIRGITHVRHKETDRIHALAAELRKLGAHVTEHEDGLTIQPDRLRPATINTYNDHRMAMSFALVGLLLPGVRINNPRCVEKTYPNFFDDLESIR